MDRLPKIFATRVQTNTMLVSLALVGIQAYILWELNGKLYELLTTADPCTVATVFAPTIAQVWLVKTLANRAGNYREDGTDNASE